MSNNGKTKKSSKKKEKEVSGKKVLFFLLLIIVCVLLLFKGQGVVEWIGKVLYAISEWFVKAFFGPALKSYHPSP